MLTMNLTFQRCHCYKFINRIEFQIASVYEIIEQFSLKICDKCFRETHRANLVLILLHYT